MYNSDSEWVSFENEESLSKKVEFVKSNGMAGISVNSIDMDDFQGSFCNQGPYPFLRHTLGLLINDKKLTKTIANPTTTTRTSTTIESSSPIPRMLTKNTPLKSASRINRKSEVTTMSPDALNSKKAAINKIINSKLPTAKPAPLQATQKNQKNSPNQAQTASFFLITPPAKLAQANKFDPNEYHHDKLIKQELRNQEQIRIQQELEQKYHQQEMHKMNNNNNNNNQLPPRPNPLPLPQMPKLPPTNYQPAQVQKLPQQGPILISPNPAQPQKSVQEWHRELQQVNSDQQREQSQQQTANNQATQQQEYQQRQRQQQEEYEHQRIANQQLELQQQQLKKMIQEQEWQLQQKNHQQAEQWIKDLQFHQQKQNEQIHLQQQQQQQQLLLQQQQRQQQQAWVIILELIKT
jgi:hypothetical protein